MGLQPQLPAAIPKPLPIDRIPLAGDLQPPAGFGSVRTHQRQCLEQQLQLFLGMQPREEQKGGPGKGL